MLKSSSAVDGSVDVLRKDVLTIMILLCIDLDIF